MSGVDPIAALLIETWNGKLSELELIQHCGRLQEEQRAPLAAILYQTWLKRSSSQLAHVIWFNYGVTLGNEGDYPGAEQAYRQALSLSPNFPQARLNLGLMLEKLNQPHAAINEWLWLNRHLNADDPAERAHLIVARNHLGRLHEILKHYDHAELFLAQSLLLDPAQNDVIHHLVFLRARQCRWPVHQPVGQVTVESMAEWTSSLAMIALSDDPQVQLDTAQRYVTRKLPPVARLPPSAPYRHRRLRVGYCSGDYCLHPVSMLMVELFELHDRKRFEVFGYCWSPEDGSELRARVIRSMDHFHRINKLGDAEAAGLIRSHEIDVLIDLQGQTGTARMAILASRPAPIQITYLGLPATTGMPEIDYVIADRFLIPESEARFYSEKPLYMPDVYMACDRKRRINQTPTRAQCQLPDGAFVFCSFNNSFKYTAEVFASWMRILARVPGSLLWLLADNPAAEGNLRAEASRYRIDPARLVFAKRLSPENYLARLRTADLFLDTYPFNAGTTANDALWVGLPVLTRSGRTFASRMAGALLTAADLPELITWDAQSYEDRAVDIATRPAMLAGLRERLAWQHEHGAVFDSGRFTRAYEAILKQLVREREDAALSVGEVGALR